jgi:cytochrome c peroxidase
VEVSVGARLPLAAAALGVSLAAMAWAAEPDGAAPVPTAWKDGRLAVPKGLPAPWIPASNPLTAEKVALGRRLFFDESLSRDRSRSCAGCHVPGACFTDERATAMGVRSQVGPRNTPSLVNAALYPALFWDGRAPSLEAQVEGPLLAPTELDMTEEELVARVREAEGYAPLFAAAFGSADVTLRRIGHALASFERTLLAADSPFDRWWWDRRADAVPDAAKRGFDLFRTKAGCASCHRLGPSDALFTDFAFHATGAGRGDDPGRFAVTGREEDRGRFRTPSLRNVAVTAPYFHDGSAATLADVIDHYDRGGEAGRPKEPEVRPLRLTKEEKTDLEAFLRSLTSPAFEECPPGDRPAEEPR